MDHRVIEKLPKRFRDKYRNAWYTFRFNLKIFVGKLVRFFRRPPFPLNPHGAVNLHLGCGQINHPRFINIDTIPAPHVHYVMNIKKLLPFKNNSVDLIYVSHTLEHFSHRDLPEILSEWFRTLKEEGILRLSVPDFDLLLEIYKENGNDINSIMQPLMGGQDYKFNYHYATFTYSSLTTLLHETGFRDVRRWQPGSSELTTFQDWSAGKIDVKGKEYPVSLNVEAVK